MASTTFTYTILTGAITQAGSIKNWVQHSSIPSDQILEEAQAFIYEQLRIPGMISTETISIAAAGSTLALPSGFLDPIYLKLDGDSDELDYVQENLLGRFTDEDGAIQTGRPARWTLIDDLIQFDAANDLTTALAGDIVFYKTPEALSTSNETNFLTDRYPTLLRRACLAFGYEHRKRQDAFLQEVALVEAAIQRANAAGDMTRRGQIMR